MGGFRAPLAPVTVVGAKETGIAYLFLLFLGGFGAHHFYLGNVGTGIFYLVTWSIGLVLTTAGLAFGAIALVIVGIALFCELFALPGMVRRTNEGLAAKLA